MYLLGTEVYRKLKEADKCVIKPLDYMFSEVEVTVDYDATENEYILMKNVYFT